MVMGRPTKYKEEFCKVAVDMMTEGCGKVEVCAAIDISYDTFLTWTNPDHTTFKKNFLESIKKGELLSQAWWEKQGRENLKETKFNPALWFMNVKNRFGKSPVPWSDKQEIDVNAKHSYDKKTDDEIDNKIKEKINKLNAGD